MTETFDPNQPITLTKSANRFFAGKLTAEADMVRLSTKESGCTGYAYVLDIVSAPEPGDVVLNCDGIKLAIDDESLNLLRGTEIDLVREGVNQVVKFNNPNVVAECGCGESFSVN
ncbi:iron-sulfur cluster assembly accessory protein [Maribrevibacterium harenarium]|uniref:Iron-sulfur cluster assembly accessory protein n=1 Tax=Maribrevibacterium harenarium TaxID=2589817 RepID=A0A501X1W3_9GAMM|nr:iron-sulfur cluster assembly accessory protein [Maribrevibacterium harenarium]TPE54466.1 iron-sulfur cluster assembly accessory protein [Maribrevibacterium harenarium]